ncbi:MAG: hypothetical protein COB54_02360 [Alphaproteobacteria bacterium]|nr:MAG: hypothetical protein COB54_02360 [Alphaproteobacteria bacterium]
MVGLEEKRLPKRAALSIGLLQAAALYLTYLALSLTDPWGYVPAMVQAGVYGLLAIAMIAVIARGLMAKSKWTPSEGMKAAFLSGMLLVIAAVLAGADASRLLEIAVKPRALFTYPVAEITMTVTPPAYMKAEAFTERLGPDGKPAGGLKPLPEGSEVLIRVKNISYAPTLIAGAHQVEFLSAEDGGFVAHFTLKDEISWQVRQGSLNLGLWPILILADDAPIIERADFRQILTGEGLFSLSLHLRDDYGLQEVTVGVVTNGGDADDLKGRTTLNITGLNDFSGETYLNFGHSDFAGSKVDLILEVSDQAGQKKQKILAGILLPAKEFTNPHARNIIDIRAKVKSHPEIRKKLARQLMALGLVPDNGQTPTIYYMALRSAYWRLINPENEADITSARDILWDLANQMEDGDSGQFTEDMLGKLAALKLSLHQRQDGKMIREQLQELDKSMILYLRDHRSSVRDQKSFGPGLGEKLGQGDKYDPENFNIKELRRLYGEILKHSHFKRMDQAIDLISYLEHGFIYQDRDILSGRGYTRFQTVSQARGTVTSLKQIQRKVMAFVYKSSAKLELANLDIKKTVNPIVLKSSFNRDIVKWVAIQKKLGVSVNDLGRTLVKSGINTADITVAANDLVRDVVESMEAGDMEAAAQYQSEILTLLNRLKNILYQEMAYSPKIL